MPDPKGAAVAADPRPPEPKSHAAAGASLLFLREEEMRAAQDLLFFAYRDFTNAADVILDELGLGRAHHRALHFIGRNPGITVGDLLGHPAHHQAEPGARADRAGRAGLCRADARAAPTAASGC